MKIKQSPPRPEQDTTRKYKKFLWWPKSCLGEDGSISTLWWETVEIEEYYCMSGMIYPEYDEKWWRPKSVRRLNGSDE